MDTSALNALSALSQTSSTTTDAAKGKPAKKELDQADFLHLMTVQLQYQDPLKPVDNQEFTAQLTSFSSLNQLVDLNKKLDAMQGEQLSLTQLQATSLIGKEVSMKGDSVHLGTDGKTTIPFQLAADAGRVSLHVTDKEGNVVRTIEAGALKAGEQTVAWDGKDDKGGAAPQDDYTVAVDAFDAQGKTVGVATLVQGVVSGVDLSGSEVAVTINGMQAPLSSLIAVRTPPST
jgi:flagellar basal-body rod modification protein FlgD